MRTAPGRVGEGGAVSSMAVDSTSATNVAQRHGASPRPRRSSTPARSSIASRSWSSPAPAAGGVPSFDSSDPQGIGDMEQPLDLHGERPGLVERLQDREDPLDQVAGQPGASALTV